MSVVTNAILTYSILEQEDETNRIGEVNKFFGESRGFVHCDTPTLERGWYGGTKMLETNVAIGSFNHLRLNDFVEHLESIKWEEPQNVQLIVQEQDDERFRIITLAPQE